MDSLIRDFRSSYRHALQVNSYNTITVPNGNSMVPLFSIDIPELRMPSISTNSEYSTWLRNFIGNLSGSKNYRAYYFEYFHKANSHNLNTLGKIDLFRIKLKEKLDYYLNNILPQNLDQESNGTVSYENLYDSLIRHKIWHIYRFESFIYSTNYHTVFEKVINERRNESKSKCLFCLMIPREYVKYYKLCYLTGNIPDNRIFQLWVSPDFDVKNSNYKYLRTVYNKNYKPLVVESGIEIVEVENIFEKICNYIDVPKASSISKLKELKNSMCKEVLEYGRAYEELQYSSRIQLVV